MLVRQAHQADVDHLARLRATWHGESISQDFVTEFRAWFRREDTSRWWWLALEGAEPVGMVNLKVFERMPSPDRPPSRWGYLANLFVVPERRGDGVGGALVAAVVERAEREQLVRIVLSPSEQSVPLYGRHGFLPATELLLRHLRTH